MTNELYLAVLPLVHLGGPHPGLTEEVLTLLPSKEFATEFFPDQVENYLLMFKSRAEKYLSGPHTKSYEFRTEQTEDGRFRVRVIQIVTP